jgi:hypothetical protein
MNKKKCNECRTEIDSEAKRCPNCRSDQRNFIMRHPILSVIGSIVVLIIVLSSISDFTSKSTDTNSEPVKLVTQENVDRYKAELENWGKGRWSDIVAGIADDGTGVLTRIYVSPLANEVAINGYCDVVRKTEMLYIPYGNKVNIFIYQNGELVKTCL